MTTFEEVLGVAVSFGKDSEAVLFFNVSTSATLELVDSLGPAGLSLNDGTSTQVFSTNGAMLSPTALSVRFPTSELLPPAVTAAVDD